MKTCSHVHEYRSTRALFFFYRDPVNSGEFQRVFQRRTKTGTPTVCRDRQLEQRENVETDFTGGELGRPLCFGQRSAALRTTVIGNLLLGSLLGITDYATNMASFWFLDTLALYAARHRGDLDEHYASVLISWLAGEIRLLREK